MYFTISLERLLDTREKLYIQNCIMPNFYKRFHCCFIGISSFPIFRISTGCDFGLEDKMKRIFEIHAW